MVKKRKPCTGFVLIVCSCIQREINNSMVNFFLSNVNKKCTTGQGYSVLFVYSTPLSFSQIFYGSSIFLFG